MKLRTPEEVAKDSFEGEYSTMEIVQSRDEEIAKAFEALKATAMRGPTHMGVCLACDMIIAALRGKGE